MHGDRTQILDRRPELSRTDFVPASFSVSGSWTRWTQSQAVSGCSGGPPIWGAGLGLHVCVLGAQSGWLLRMAQRQSFGTWARQVAGEAAWDEGPPLLGPSALSSLWAPALG